MPLSKFPSGVSSFGIPVIGSGPVLTTGNVWFVNSAAAGNSDGKSPLGAFKTIAAAQTAATASNGDVVFLMPGHAETVSSATGMALSKAGVTYYGLGTGSTRPTITLDTATTATIAVSAANIRLEGIVFSANFADIVSLFTTTTAKNFTVVNCEVVETAVNMNFIHVVDTSTTDNDADGLTFTNNLWLEPDAATLAFALVDATQDRWNVSDNVMVNGAATADIAFMFTIAAGKILTGLRSLRNQCQMTGNSGTVAGIFLTTNQTTNTGIVAYNNLKHTDATTEIWQTSNAGFGLFENRATAVGTAQGYLLPAIDA